MKVAILVYSKTGITQETGELIGKGVASVEGCEYRVMSIEDLDKDYVNAADAVVFGTPTYYANMAWQMKKWIDEGCSGLNLAGKLGAVFATANVIGGGSETALLTLINHILVKGMVVYSGGCACGKPYTHIGLTRVNEVPLEQQQEKITLFGQRIAQKAKELFVK